MAADGTPVNAVRGFLDFIARLVTDHRPTHLVACWDEDWRPAFRVEAIPSYKAHRVAAEVPDDVGPDVEEVPDTLSPQVPVIIDVLAALGIARVGAAGYEADDVIGTLCANASGPVDVVTGDRDLFQLVDDARDVRVLYTAAKGVGERRGDRRGGGGGEVRHPGPGVRRLRRAARRPQRRPARRGGRRRQDRGGADHDVRHARRGPRRSELGRQRHRPAVRARIIEAADYLAVAPRGGRAWPPTCRSRRTTRRLPAVRPTPRPWWTWPTGGTSAPASTASWPPSVR